MYAEYWYPDSDPGNKILSQHNCDLYFKNNDLAGV